MEKRGVIDYDTPSGQARKRAADGKGEPRSKEEADFLEDDLTTRAIGAAAETSKGHVIEKAV